MGKVEGHRLLTDSRSYKWQQFNDTVCLSKIPGIFSPSRVPRTLDGHQRGGILPENVTGLIPLIAKFPFKVFIGWQWLFVDRRGWAGKKLANYNSIDQLRWPRKCLETRLIIAEISMNWLYNCPTSRLQSIIKTDLNNHINFSRAAGIAAAQLALRQNGFQTFFTRRFQAFCVVFQFIRSKKRRLNTIRRLFCFTIKCKVHRRQGRRFS